MNWSRFHALNMWYDQQAEPKRFFIMIGLYGILVVPPSLFIPDIGFSIGFMLFVLCGLYRIHYSHVWPKIAEEQRLMNEVAEAL